MPVFIMNNKSPKFLVIDDDRASLALVKATLSGQQYDNIDLFLDAQEAQKSYLANDYDILILDLRMPNLNGFEILREMQNLGAPSPNIIVITAYAEPENTKKALQLGAKKVFLKPFDVSELVKEIEQLLGDIDMNQ